MQQSWSTVLINYLEGSVWSTECVLTPVPSMPSPPTCPAARGTLHCVHHKVVQYCLAFDCQRWLVKETHMHRVYLNVIMNTHVLGLSRRAALTSIAWGTEWQKRNDIRSNAHIPHNTNTHTHTHTTHIHTYTHAHMHMHTQNKHVHVHRSTPAHAHNGGDGFPSVLTFQHPIWVLAFSGKKDWLGCIGEVGSSRLCLLHVIRCVDSFWLCMTRMSQHNHDYMICTCAFPL